MTKPTRIVSSVSVPAPRWRTSHAEGAVVRLSDGRDYLDLMNGKGCVTLGHNHPAVVGAMIESLRAKAGCASCWSDPFDELATIIATDSGIPDARLAFFSTGTEACRAAVQCARRFSGRKLIASAGYHGWGDLWSPGPAFLYPNENGVVDFYFVPELLEQVLQRYRDQIAMVIIAPDYVHLRPETLKNLVRLARERNVLFCCDDVKNGYRAVAGSALPGCTGETADLYIFSKGLSNGQRLSCLVGEPEVVSKAKHMTYTSYLDVLPVVAALATLKLMRAEQGHKRLSACGATLSTKLQALTDQFDLPIKVMGDGPLMQFIAATEALDEALYATCAQRGLLLYERDNQAVSLATEQVLPELEVRFEHVFGDLSEYFRPLRGAEVPMSRQIEAAFGMMDGLTDAVPPAEAIRWLRERQE